MRYLPLAEADRREMLRAVGAQSIDDLFVDVPEAARLGGTIEGLADHASELSVERQLGALARQNLVAGEVPFFLGCGAYRHHIPSSKRCMSSPGAPSVSSGTAMSSVSPVKRAMVCAIET